MQLSVKCKDSTTSSQNSTYIYQHSGETEQVHNSNHASGELGYSEMGLQYLPSWLQFHVCSLQ